MKVKLFSMLAILFLVGNSLFAQPPCTEYPSPVIQPDFISLCQDPPKEDPHGNPFNNNNPNPDPTPDRKDECQVVCENSPVTYTNPNAGAGNTITWEAFGDVTPATGTGTSFTVTWGAPGTGLIQVTETTPDGCSTTVNVCVKIVESPKADFTSLPPEVSGIIQVCDGTEVFFQDQSSSDVITWVWDFGDGTQSNDPNPSHVYQYDPSYSFYVATLTVYNDCGCSDTKTVRVIVDPAQAPVISCVSTVCEGDEAKYTVTNGCVGGSYNWTATGGTVVNVMDNMVWVIWDSPINGQGTLTVEIVGCPDICTIPTTVVVPILTANLSLEGPDIVCVGDLVEYTIPPQPGSIYSWFGTAAPFFASSPNDHSIDLYWTTAGTYTLCVRLAYSNIITDSEPPCDIPYKDQYCKTIQVKQPFVVFPEFAEICETDSYSFCTNPTPSGVTWTASQAGMTPIALPSGPCTTASGLAPGFYEITASTSDNSYCNTTASGFLTVKPSAPTLLPGALTGITTICPGSSYDYSATPDNGYYLQWTANGGTVIGTGNDVAITWDLTPPAFPGYFIEITQVPMTGPACPSVTTFPITQLVPVTPVITGFTTVCADAETMYSASPLTDVTFMEWVITTPALASIVGGQNTPNATIQFNNALGTVNIEFRYTVCNTVYIQPYSVVIDPLPVVNFPTVSDPCQNDLTFMSASLVPSPGGTITWDWTFGDGGTGTGASTSHTWLSTGTFPVGVTATYSGGACTGSSTANQLINVKPAPLVNITSTNGTNLCPPVVSTTLVASVTTVPGGGGIYSYAWTGPIAGTGPTLFVNVTGTYTLTVIDLVNGCTSTKNVVVGSNCNPPCTGVDFTISQSCNSFNFNAVLAPGYGSPTWNFGDGSGASGNTASHTYTASGYYFVSLTAVNGTTVCTKIYRVTVLFIPDFAVEFSCPGNAIQVSLFDQTDYIPGTPLSYSWTYPGGPSTMQNPTPLTMAPGPNPVSITVTSGSTTCTYSGTINVPTPIDAAFIADDPACEGNPIHFTNTSTPSVGDIATASWNFGDLSGSNLVDAERTYTFANSGMNPLVTLQVTDVWGCTDSFSDNVTVNENILTNNVTVNVPAPGAFCPSPPVTLGSTIPGATVSPAYAWGSNGGVPYALGSLGTGANSNPIPATGEYVVEVTDAFGCKEQSPAATVIIIPEPVAYIIGQDEYCIYDQLQLSANQGSGYTYLWSYTTPSGGPFSSSATAQSFQLTQAGTYTFTVTLTDNITGCSNTSSVFTVTVHDEPQGLAIASSGVCVPANLTASVTGPAGVSYVWSNGTNGATTVALGGGTIQVTAYTPEGCSTSETIDIGEGPDLSDVAVGCYCFPEATTWTAPQGQGYSYQWFMNGGSVGTNNFQYTITASGEYYVIVTSPNGCSSTSDPIIVDIGEACAECKFEVKLLKLECIGIDQMTGGTIYSFMADITNFHISLSGLTGTSAQGIVSGLSPTTLPGSGAITTVTGTFTLMPPNTSAVINFQAAGANGLACDYNLAIDQFPPCDDTPCEVIWHHPTITCINTVNGYNYYTFSVAASNLGNTLTNLVWYPCSSPDVTITTSTNTLPASVSTIFTGIIRVRVGINSDCFRVCGWDPIAKKECCTELTMDFPDCDVTIDPCKEMEDLGSKLICLNPSTDPFGNPVYGFDINVYSGISGGNAYLIPWFDQAENNVTGLSVSVSGNQYQLTGTVIDVPGFNDPLCFRVITYDGEKFCWMKLCLKLPDCKAKPCDVTWYEPQIECFNVTSDYTYYTFSISATNLGNTLTNVVWFPCTSTTSITSSVSVLAGNASTIMEGMIRVPTGTSTECFRVCGYNPTTGEKCCWDIDMQFPECSEFQQPCEDMKLLSKQVTCGNPLIDPYGNKVYNFTFTFSSHLTGAMAYLLPWFNQMENHVTNLNVSVSGNTYTVSGTYVDVPGFNDPLCFRVITYDGHEICWTRFCVKIPVCSSTEGGGQEEALIRNSNSSQLMQDELNVVPNPATDLITVSFDLKKVGNVELKMIGVNGQLVRHITNMNPQTTLPLDISDLSGGLYLIAIIQDGVIVAQKKVAVIE